MAFLSNFVPSEILKNLVLAFKIIYLLASLWLPAIFLWLFFNAWLNYKRTKFWEKEGSVLLEIKLPREINKSPLAMEVVLNALHQPSGEGTWIDRIWKGQTRPWFSLEVVSLGGKVRFFIWMWSKYKNVVENQIYSQYPEVEIYEAEDYAIPFYYDPEKNDIWGTEFTLTKPDPFPIKTYVDYGLDKDPKEEFKIDPMTPMIEFLGSLTSDHFAGIQIIIRAHKKRRLFDIFGEKEDSWEEEAKAAKEKILKDLKASKEEFPRIPSKGEAEKIAALERSVSKFPFDCCIRGIYLADKDKFNPGNKGGILGAVKQFSSLDLNGFKAKGWFNIFDYPWQEWFGAKEKLKPLILEEYKLRRFFYSPLKGKKFYTKPFVLNVEELATIYHFPGAVAATPTLEKIPSTKAKAPPNLPT